MFGESYVDGGSSKVAHATSHKAPSHTSSPASPAAAVVASPTQPPPPSSTPARRSQSVKEIIKKLDEEQDISGPKGNCCSRIFVPFLIALLIVVIFGAILYTNGSGSDVEAAPRVALIVLDGFSGTIFHALMQSGVHLPNIASMLSSREGVWAECATNSQSSCARAVMVENETTGEVYVSAGAAITSIFSGVTPPYHQVYNSSLASMSAYATTSNVYPSIAKRVTDAGLGVTAVGTAHLINSLNPAVGSCSLPGVLDMECAASQADLLQTSIDEFTGNVQLDCLASTSCNTHTRKPKSPTDPQQCSDGHAELQFTRLLRNIFGELAYTTPTQKTATPSIVADQLDDSLFIFHFDALAVRAASPFLPNFQYNTTSKEYVAQAYLLDALVGQIMSYIRDRSRSQKENWLLLGIADHGGADKQFQDALPTSSSTDAIAFFMATYTSNTKGYISLAPLERPVSQLDVLPTVLSWLGVAPFDADTNAVLAGTNSSAASAEVEGYIAQRKHFEGHVQGICSSGAALLNCAT